jgi:hypothetical protein
MSKSSYPARLRGYRLLQRRVETRFPFRFGRVSMTAMPLVYLEAEWESGNGGIFKGRSASGIPPLWFDKRDGKTAEDNARDLGLSLAAAGEAYREAGAASAWDLHRAVTEPVRGALAKDGIAPLAAGFGPALFEAALADGICRELSLPFFQALKHGTLGVPAEAAAALPSAPTAFLHYRHTVGLADPIAASEVTAPLNDGLPESLEDVIRAYEPSYFKVKVGADSAENLDRLRRIASRLATVPDYKVTLDGNEQYASMESFADFLDLARAEPALAGFLQRVLWIEQPVRRDAALDPAAAAAMSRVSDFKPVILDESDGEADALRRGLDLGYSGVSSKTCKGLFRSVSHAATLAAEARKGRAGLILSAEDLTTVPVHPLQQDLSLAASLGLTHSERNGHHYILPSGFLTGDEQAQALRECPSLYENDPRAGLRVRLANGGFDLREVHEVHGFGSATAPDFSALEPFPHAIPSTQRSL